MKTVANLADSSYKTGVKMVEDKVVHAIQILESEVQGKLMLMQYYLPPAPENIEFCSFCDKDGTNAPAAINRGLQIYQNNTVSPFSCFYVDKIYIKSATTVTKTIRVEDADGGLIASFQAELQANKVTTITANLCIFETLAYIVMDNDNVTTFKSNCAKFTECCGGVAHTRPNKFYSVKGWDGEHCVNEGFGIAISGGRRCDMSSLMCYILPYIKQAVLYQTGIEILNEMLASDRLNLITIYSKDWAKEQIPAWEERVQLELNSVIPTLVTQLKKKDRECLACLDRGVKVTSAVNPFKGKYNTKELERNKRLFKKQNKRRY